MAKSESWVDIAKSGVIEGTKLAYDWETKYADDEGKLVNKKFLINKLQRSIATGLEDFTVDFKTSELSGDFVLDKRLPQFLIEEKQLDDILANYSTAAFAGTGEKLKKAYKDFTDALSARNNDMVAYNAVIQTIASQDQQVTKLRDMRQMANKGKIVDEGEQKRHLRYLNH